MPDEPTPWELHRRIESLRQEVVDDFRRLEERDRDHAADLAHERVERKADIIAEREARKGDRRDDTAFRRQVLLGVGLAAIGTLTTVALFVASLMVR